MQPNHEYSLFVATFRRLFRCRCSGNNGTTYRKINEIVRDVDVFISDFLLNNDVIEIAKSGSGVKEKSSTLKDISDEAAAKIVSELATEKPSRKPEVKKTMEVKPPKVQDLQKTEKESNTVDLEDDGDEALISKRIAEEKKKLAASKKASKKKTSKKKTTKKATKTSENSVNVR